MGLTVTTSVMIWDTCVLFQLLVKSASLIVSLCVTCWFVGCVVVVACSSPTFALLCEDCYIAPFGRLALWEVNALWRVV